MKTMNQEELLEKLKEAVVEMEEEDAARYSREYLELGYDPVEGISRGLAAGMDKAGRLYEEEEYYIPELLLCSDAMYAGMEVFRPYLLKNRSESHSYKAVIGVVEGDIHDIGKNLFKIMLETCGFEVIDLGKDVPPAVFVETVKKEKAHLVGMSTLMTTTMENMNRVMEILKEEGVRDEIVVMVGGGPISQEFAEKIGADGYEREASRAARLALELVQEKNQHAAH